jgi:hypothetical protein
MKSKWREGMSQLQSILEKELSRKEFLRYLGIFILTIVGIKGIYKKLTSVFDKKQVASGYGNVTYGGKDA